MAPAPSAGVANGRHPVLPLIWEATGRPGTLVKQFLDGRFVGGHSSRKKLILAQAESIIVRYTALAVIYWLRAHSPDYRRGAQNVPVLGQGARDE